MEKIDLHIKMDVALEALSAKIASMSKKGYTIKDKEMLDLLEERKRLYSGDEEILDKIIDVYGKEMKSKFDEVGKN